MGSRWKVLWVVLMLVILSEATTSGSSEGKKKTTDKVDDDLLDDDEATVHDDDVVTMKLDDYEIEYKTPVPSDSKSVYLSETFDSVALAKTKWTPSQATKSSSDSVFKYSGVWDFDLPERRIFPNDRALILRSKAAHAAISAPLSRPFEFTTKPLVVQYEVTFQNGMDCGGAYIKLLSQASKEPLNLAGFHDKTPYTIMFGPDKCGSDIKLHFIFRHKHPLNGSYSEKHAKRPSNRLEETFSDKKPHLYKLILRPTNRFEVYVDGSLINSGTLLEDMEPPVNPSMEIEDPNDSKPEDWDEREKIPDKNAAKPADWNEDEPPKIPDPDAKVPSGWLEDEPESIPDPNAVQPEDWDESMDGTWEPPLISNPACEEAVGCGPWTPPLVENPNFKGRWNPPLVDNPNYRGKWTRRMIPNPDYFEDKEPFKMTPIGAVGLEIWTMTENVLWDNFIVADNPEVVDKWTEETYQVKIRALERDSRGVVERIINYSNKHPWLYAVYTLVIGLPVVLIIAFWCGGNDKKSVGAEMPNEIQEEDEDEPEEVAKQEEVIAPQAKKNGAVSKDDLEKDDEVSQGEDGEQEEEDDEGWVQTNKEEGDENDEQGEDEEEAEDDEKDDEVVDEVIEDKPESRENSQLKKRRTRRD